MRRGLILRSLDPEPGGGGGVAGGGAVAAADEVVTISRVELDELRARIAAAAGSGSQHDGKREEWAEALKARDAEYSREIAASERKTVALEQAYKAALLDRELATALVGKPLVPGAAAQLIRLWRDAFEVIDGDGDGAIRVVSREGRSVDQAVADRLSGPEFAHFCLPSSRGGTGHRGQNRSATPAPAPPAPRTLGEAVLHQWREASARQLAAPGSPGWGRRR